MMPKLEKQPELEAPTPISELDKLLNLAASADRHAAALAADVRQIYDNVLAAKSRNANRGPSGIVLYNSLQRAAAKHFAGTPILRMQRGAHPALGGFRAQVESWIPTLSTPTPIPSAPPPPPPAARQAA
jgi:hypothetical protein